MAITFELVEATPSRLRYLATQDGVISSPPVAADGFNTIPNAAGASPDLKTDIDTVAAPGAGGVPLKELVDANRNGLGAVIAAGAMTQAQARAIFMRDDAAGAVLTNNLVARGLARTAGRTGQGVAWAADANVIANSPVIEVRSGVGVAATAYVDIHRSNTYDL